MIFQIYNPATEAYVDLLPLILNGMLTWNPKEVIGINENVASNGKDIIDESGTKDSWTVLFPSSVSVSDASTIFTLLKPPTVTVKYLSPETGTEVIKTMRRSNRTATASATEGWDGISFTLTATEVNE